MCGKGVGCKTGKVGCYALIVGCKWSEAGCIRRIVGSIALLQMSGSALRRDLADLHSPGPQYSTDKCPRSCWKKRYFVCRKGVGCKTGKVGCNAWIVGCKLSEVGCVGRIVGSNASSPLSGLRCAVIEPFYIVQDRKSTDKCPRSCWKKRYFVCRKEVGCKTGKVGCNAWIVGCKLSEVGCVGRIVGSNASSPLSGLRCAVIEPFYIVQDRKSTDKCPRSCWKKRYFVCRKEVGCKTGKVGCNAWIVGCKLSEVGCVGRIVGSNTRIPA
ncbi:hypothetical protein RKD52_000171 [Metabacillus sp. SLBN-84]